MSALALSPFFSREAIAQPEPTSAAPADVPTEVTAPILKEHVEAVYPPEALRQRIEGSVGLALTIDEAGVVQEVQVTTPAGHGFDEAAMAAARKFIFEPASRAGRAIRATVQFSYRFQLPLEPARAVPASSQDPIESAPPPRKAVDETPPSASPQTGSDQATVVVASRPRMAASSTSIGRRDLTLRPVASAQDLLRATPGLVVVQHAGGGKANQYFLRGFDADHGTDVALSFDGVPINMVTHAHGQGFADTNFIIPEAIERLDVTKGPYFPNQGDFATAGAVNLVSRDDLEHASLGFGVGGSPGHGEPSYRGLLMASPKTESTKSLLAAEIGRQNGPFDRAEAWDRYKVMSKLTVALGATSSVTFGALSYAGNWNGSGQLPARAVASGLVPRYGALDPSEGGSTARHQAFLQYRLTSESSELKALAYIGSYRFNLFSNFTFYLRDPARGDEIEQVDRRTFYGGKVSYRTVRDVGGVKVATTIGADMRGDQIRAELWNGERRTRTSPAGLYRVEPTSVGAFANAEVTPVDWVRIDVGGRADLLSFAVEDRVAATTGTPSSGGVGAATQWSPKASMVVTQVKTEPLTLDTFVNYGHGFHSNDVRGAFARPAVTPLARAIGSEVGTRARILRRFEVSAALWQLDLETETVWSGDEGTTDVSGSTHREGAELDARYEPFPWLMADAGVTFSRSKYRAETSYGSGLALAPKQTWTGGVSGLHPIGGGTARYGVRFYGIGDRPASDDGVLVARGFTQVDLHVGYRHRWFDLGIDLENLLDTRYRSAQFATVGRLATEPPIGEAVSSGFSCGRDGRLAQPSAGSPSGSFAGCEDVHFTPAYPFSIRFMATLFLDPQ